MRWSVALGIAAGCAGSTSTPSEPTTEDWAAEVSAPGPRAVGYAQATVAYTPIGGGEVRELPVEVWYPADPAGEAPAEYLVAGIAKMEAPLALDAPAAASGPFPVAVYSHGSGGLGLLAWPYAERLASHGWVVVSADHVGNTSFDLLAGGGDPFIRTMVNRPNDVSALLDAIDAAAPTDPWAGGDTSQVLLFGHSFGGYTTLAAGGASVDASVFTPGCEDAPEEPDCALLADPAIVDELSRGLLDPRIDAIAPQAPALYLGFGDAALAAVTLPTLLMSAGRDRTTPDANEARPIWQAMGDGADRWIRIPDGGHYSFISVCDDVGLDVIEMFEPGASADGCGPDFTPTLETVPVLASYLLAFGRAEVLGEEALRGVLDLSLHPGFEVQTP